MLVGNHVRLESSLVQTHLFRFVGLISPDSNKLGQLQWNRLRFSSIILIRLSERMRPADWAGCRCSSLWGELRVLNWGFWTEGSKLKASNWTLRIESSDLKALIGNLQIGNFQIGSLQSHSNWKRSNCRCRCSLQTKWIVEPVKGQRTWRDLESGTQKVELKTFASQKRSTKKVRVHHESITAVQQVANSLSFVKRLHWRSALKEQSGLEGSLDWKAVYIAG